VTHGAIAKRGQSGIDDISLIEEETPLQELITLTKSYLRETPPASRLWSALLISYNIPAVGIGVGRGRILSMVC